MKIKCVIIDDEPLAINVLEEYIHSFSKLELVGKFSNSLEGLAFLNSNPDIDVVFVDIKMSMLTGFELVKSLKYNFSVIFTTAYREFAAESYDLDVLDYLVKPIPLTRFTKSVERIELEYHKKNDIKVETKEEPYILVKVDKKLIKIELEDILFVEGMKEYVKIVTLDKMFITYRTLTSISEELTKNNFLRVHKSFTIAINKVIALESNRVKVKKDYIIPIGRNFIKETKTKILNNLGVANVS